MINTQSTIANHIITGFPDWQIAHAFEYDAFRHAGGI